MPSVGEFVLVQHPTSIMTVLSGIAAFAALGSTPNFVPLVLLLAALKLYIAIMAPRPLAFLRGALLWIVLSGSIGAAYWAPSRNALSSPVMGILLLSAMSGVTCMCSIIILCIDVRFCMRARAPWMQLMLFPTLYTTTWGLISMLSPVGRLLCWSPVVGLGPYAWLRPITGQWGVDLVAASWSVVVFEVTTAWFLGTPTGTRMVEDHLISIETADEERDHGHHIHSVHPTSLPPSKTRRAMILGAALFALMVPSFYSQTLPLPPYADETTPVTVGCVLPTPPSSGGALTLEDYIIESAKWTGARVLLWPEGAIRFDNEQQKRDAIEQVQKRVRGPYVGMAFEEVLPRQPGSHESNLKRRNGLVLVGPEGPVFEYSKRQLVPVAESFALSASTDPPTIYDMQLASPKGTAKTKWGSAPNYTRPLPLTGSICLDFSSPSTFTELDSRPALILAPARTWQTSVGVAMWQQARARAEEIGSQVLWCDGGEGGVSGIGGGGVSEFMQVGAGSWVKTIGVQYPFDQARTVFGAGGNALAFALILLPLGLGWAVEGLVMGEKRDHTHIPVRQGIEGISRRLHGAFKRMRGAGQGEQQPLLQ